eukprot:scaffold161841_cov16-Tisochrysis_lutea.AAC.1
MDDDPEQAEKLAKLQQKLEEGLQQREMKQQQQQQQQEGSKQQREGTKQQQQQQQLESKEEQQQQRAAATGALELHGPLDLPYTIKMPDSYPKFAALVSASVAASSCPAVGPAVSSKAFHGWGTFPPMGLV